MRDEALQHLGVGAIAAFGLLPCRQAHLLKEERPQLLGGVDVKLFACQLIDFPFQPGDETLQLLPEGLQPRKVDEKALLFHGGQHLGQGNLHLMEQHLHPAGGNLPFQPAADGQQPGGPADHLRGLLRSLPQEGGDRDGVFRPQAGWGVLGGIGAEEIPRQTQVKGHRHLRGGVQGQNSAAPGLAVLQVFFTGKGV